MASQPISSIAMALAGKTASVDIPQPRAGLAPNASSRLGQPAMLPTPPNSISPNLPPHAFKHRPVLSPGSPLSTVPQLDSDIDLQDTADHHNNQNRSLPLHELDSVGTITPTMLATYHLPDILLQQGPLAIRHVMGFLTTSVPGFSRIPPAKARRLVVAALESRGLEASGAESDVIFEKVGWGRWDARRRDEASRSQAFNASSPPSSVAGSFQQRGLQIEGRTAYDRRDSYAYGVSMDRKDSTAFSFTEDYGARGEYEDLDMLEHEADKMSLDGDEREYCSSSEAPDDLQDGEFNEGDVTDEEDWAQIGADALRARSLNTAGFVHGNMAGRAKALHSGIFGSLGGPAPFTVAKSTPRTFDNQERAAVEALLRLGSM
ncbi:hypothetical protein N7495_005808 [Penicillium taxi]|uniref:uncharacterized protein n=1 Tax=Penicillium taxi TaxID=168475 RepID=UPI00254528A4|nr:uncharacterized protein N7495_005808 [Penicillium taxi]KAJ5894117.1 hypothetical protein N7495_005808 [Penicillium taxi]